jgi:hypothetical protein
MSRISIDVTPEQHQKLKALAALRGKSIKQFVLERTLGALGRDPDLAELEAMLDDRIAASQAAGTNDGTVADVFARARREKNSGG